MVDNLKEARNTNQTKDAEINKILKETSERETVSEMRIKTLEQALDEKNNECHKEVRKNVVIRNLINKKDEDIRKLEENLKHQTENEKQTLDSNKSCDICDFIGKSKADILKHKKIKHIKKKTEKNKEQVDNQKKSEVRNDDFADKINDFLKSVNYLNNSESNHTCEKCSAKFASKDFLEIHIGATHKIKCDVCEFETGHKESMKQHIANPGIWHRNIN